jgi:hypothetical protein
MVARGANDVVKVRIERRGGLAGLHLSVEHGCESLEPQQREAIAFLSTAASNPSAPTGADRFQYRVHLAYADGSERTIDVSEAAMPEALVSLTKAASPQRRT